MDKERGSTVIVVLRSRILSANRRRKPQQYGQIYGGSRAAASLHLSAERAGHYGLGWMGREGEVCGAWCVLQSVL